MHIVFIGPPGAGKGTQCRRLSQTLGVPHLSTGEILRASKESADLGETISNHIDRGQLAPDLLVMGLVRKHISALPIEQRQGCVFDGIPRTLPQVDLLDQFLNESGQRVDIVLSLEVPEDVLLQRLLERAAIEQRADDNETAIRSRFRIFRERTAPILDCYGARDLVRKVDGTVTPDEVFEAVRAEISRI